MSLVRSAQQCAWRISHHSPMYNSSLLVQIIKCLCHLHDDVPREIFAKVSQTDDLVEEFAARTQLQDDEVVLPAFREVDEADDVGVLQLAHDLDFLQNVRPLIPMTSATAPLLVAAMAAKRMQGV